MTNEEIIRKVTEPEIVDMDFTKEELIAAMNAAREDEAIDLAEWCAKKSFSGKNKGIWDCPEISKGSLTTSELYQIFKQQK